MNGPFRSPQVPLEEMVRRAEEAVRRAEEENVRDAEGNAVLAKEIALRVQLRGRGRNGVLWATLVFAALFFGAVGGLAGSLLEPAPTPEQAAAEKRLEEARSGAWSASQRCRDERAAERSRLFLCEKRIDDLELAKRLR